MASCPLPSKLTAKQAGKVRRIMRVALDGGTQTKAARMAGLSRSAMIKFLDDLAGIPHWPPHIPTLARLSLLPVENGRDRQKKRYMTRQRLAREMGLRP